MLLLRERRVTLRRRVVDSSSTSVTVSSSTVSPFNSSSLATVHLVVAALQVAGNQGEENLANAYIAPATKAHQFFDRTQSSFNSNVPNSRDFVLEVGHSATEERTRDQKEEHHFPHSQSKGRQEEEEKVGLEATREVVLVAVLHGGLPGDVTVSAEGAQLRATKRLNSFSTRNIILIHPQAVQHGDAAKQAQEKDKGYKHALLWGHEVAKVKVGEEGLEGQVHESQEGRELVAELIASPGAVFRNIKILCELQCFHGSEVSNACSWCLGALFPKESRSPHGEGKQP